MISIIFSLSTSRDMALTLQIRSIGTAAITLFSMLHFNRVGFGYQRTPVLLKTDLQKRTVSVISCISFLKILRSTQQERIGTNSQTRLSLLRTTMPIRSGTFLERPNQELGDYAGDVFCQLVRSVHGLASCVECSSPPIVERVETTVDLSKRGPRRKYW